MRKLLTILATVASLSCYSQSWVTDENIDRTKFGIKYSSGSFFKNLGDKMIYDNFSLTVNINY